MKSLVESLFDKDLVEKDLPSFGSKYSVHCVLVNDDDYNRGGQSYSTRDDEYKWLLNTVKLANLKKDIKNPIKIDNKKSGKIDSEYIMGWRADERFCEVIGYIVSIINMQPLDDNQLNIINPIDMRLLGKKLDPYLKNMKGNPMTCTGGRYYFTKRGSGETMFELYRKDKRFIIVFDKKK
jgi:hypothetical protein